jgi:hypothetical protein
MQPMVYDAGLSAPKAYVDDQRNGTEGACAGYVRRVDRVDYGHNTQNAQ